jgi:hypothetical protein
MTGPRMHREPLRREEPPADLTLVSSTSSTQGNEPLVHEPPMAGRLRPRLIPT